MAIERASGTCFEVGIFRLTEVVKQLSGSSTSLPSTTMEAGMRILQDRLFLATTVSVVGKMVFCFPYSSIHPASENMFSRSHISQHKAKISQYQLNSKGANFLPTPIPVSWGLFRSSSVLESQSGK